MDEFNDDVMRIVSVAKLLTKLKRSGETNVRLLINHLVILENVFGRFYLVAIREYIGSDMEALLNLNSILKYMGRLELTANYNQDFYSEILKDLS